MRWKALLILDILEKKIRAFALGGVVFLGFWWVVEFDEVLGEIDPDWKPVFGGLPGGNSVLDMVRRFRERFGPLVGEIWVGLFLEYGREW